MYLHTNSFGRFLHREWIREATGGEGGMKIFMYEEGCMYELLIYSSLASRLIRGRQSKYAALYCQFFYLAAKNSMDE